MFCMHLSAIIAPFQDNLRNLGYLTQLDYGDLFQVKANKKEYNKFKEGGSEKTRGRGKPIYLSAMRLRLDMNTPTPQFFYLSQVKNGQMAITRVECLKEMR